MDMKRIIAERLKRQRMREGLNQQELAMLSGIPYQVISRLEHGHQSIYVERIAALATKLHTTIDYLAGLTDDPAPAKKPARRRETAAVG
jgi:transcriptional regulator with XRE-family HTH domain